MLPKSPLRSPERYDRQHSRARAASRGVPKGASVRKPLHGGCGSAILSVPGRPKRKSWLKRLDRELTTYVDTLMVGDVTAFRDALTARGLAYHLHVQGGLIVWPPGTTFTVPPRRGAPLRGLPSSGGASSTTSKR